MNDTLNPFENAVDLSRRIEDLDARIAALDAQKRGLAVDPANATEQAVEAMIKTEADIEAKIAPLQKIREILTGNLSESWKAAEAFIKPQFVVAMDEAFALLQRGEQIGIRILDSLAPNSDRGHPYAVINAMCGLSDARALNAECGNLFRAHREDNASSRIAYVTNLANHLAAFSDQVSIIAGKFSELAAAAEEMERRFSPPAEAPSLARPARGRQKLTSDSEEGEEPR